MEIVIMLIPLALLILAIAIAAFFWAVRNDQFDDLDSPAWKVILDDQEGRHRQQQPGEQADTRDSTDARDEETAQDNSSAGKSTSNHKPNH